jgi:hypothetical protein
MFNINDIINYFKEVNSGVKFQLSAIVTFGAALTLVWLKEDNELKIFLTFLFLFPLCMFVFGLIEKVYMFIRCRNNRIKAWNSLTFDERRFLLYYLINKTKTQYIPCINGTYTDSGIINPLIHKKILYLGSTMSEYRGEDWMSMEQHFPINIHDLAYEYLRNKYEADKKTFEQKDK